MGTNFYITADQDIDAMNPEFHIGKRSAAGLYCWNCRMTLAIGGEAGVHSAAGHYERCPKCGQEQAVEELALSAAGRELGFNRSIPARKSGVRSCSSFTWTMEPATLEGHDTIWDEYGRAYTRAEFLAVLEECPIQFRKIGAWFA